MCLDPVSGSLLAVSAVGGVMQSIGQLQAGRAAQNQADYQSKVAKNNAVVAGWQSNDALERGAQEQANYARQIETLKGRQRAAFAANGVELGSGSPLGVLGDTALLGSMDLSTMRANAQREALGLHNESRQFSEEARLLKMQGQSAANAGKSAFATGLLGTAANTAIGGYGMSKYAKVPAGGITWAHPEGAI